MKIVPLEPSYGAARYTALLDLQHDAARNYLDKIIVTPQSNALWLSRVRWLKARNTALAFYIILAGERDDTYSGEIAIDEINPKTCVANVFYWIRPSMRGHNLAAAAIKTLIARLNESAGAISWLQFAINPQNLSSLRVAEKAGAIDCELLDRELTVRKRPDPRKRYFYLPLNTRKLDG